MIQIFDRTQVRPRPLPWYNLYRISHVRFDRNHRNRNQKETFEGSSYFFKFLFRCLKVVAFILWGQNDNPVCTWIYHVKITVFQSRCLRGKKELTNDIASFCKKGNVAVHCAIEYIVVSRFWAKLFPRKNWRIFKNFGGAENGSTSPWQLSL